MSQQKEISKLEVDVLLILYNFSDQFGDVDMSPAIKWAKEKLGVEIPDTPFTFDQYHLDILMDIGAIPDTRPFLSICAKKPRRRKTNRKPEKE